MKIATVTLALHTNYGGILQAYALQSVLEGLGHKVSVLDKARKPPFKLLWIICKRLVKRFILRKQVAILPEIRYYRETANKNKNTWVFADKYIHRREIRTFREINEKEFDALVVGSDQIWRNHYLKDNYHSVPFSFLGFATDWDIKRIAYAASLGTDEWEYSDEETALCRELIQKFDAVSVRETSGVDLLKTHLHYDKACQHIDPTFLLDKEHYIRLFTHKKIKPSGGNLLLYILDETPEKLQLVEKVIQETGLIPFRVNSRVEDANATNRNQVQPPVENWLRGFYDAEYIVTDSYHACIFSIIFGKPFIVYGNKDRGLARFDSLLGMFHLEDRMVSDMDSFDFRAVKSSIAHAQELLAEHRKRAMDFLRTHLQ